MSMLIKTNFIKRHFNKFEACFIEHIKQEEVGSIPRKWADSVITKRTKDFSRLSNEKVTRNFLYNSNLETKELVITILSWGGMRRNHGRLFFQTIEKPSLLKLLEGLRKNKIDTIDAYKRFFTMRKEGNLQGMGPAFFTKLIHFLPSKPNNGYIMDQWTSKSINLLAGKSIVKLSKYGYVSDENTYHNYELFCNMIENLAKYFKKEGKEIEEALFSSGGKSKGQWRKYVKLKYQKIKH